MPSRRSDVARQRAGAALAALRGQLQTPPPAPPPPPPAPPEVSPEDLLVELIRERPPAPFGHTDPISSLLHSRLSPDDVAAITHDLDGTFKELWETSGPIDQRRLELTFAAHKGLDEALDRTGLSAAMPPEQVHAMAHGPLAAGGDPWLADAMVAAMTTGGFTLSEGSTILDFGCSSGRVLRTIAAARPDLRCVGCDPNETAVAWASTHLPGIEFFVSPNRPPLDLPDSSVDGAYALSIWSHFAEEPALAWLEEMHRILRPGGRLVLTTHGYDSIAHLLRGGAISTGSAAGALTTLLHGGLHFIDVFGEAGDWGVVDPGWGNAYLTLDWLAAHTTPAWTIELHRPGGLDGNQDLVVLARR